MPNERSPNRRVMMTCAANVAAAPIASPSTFCPVLPRITRWSEPCTTAGDWFRLGDLDRFLGDLRIHDRPSIADVTTPGRQEGVETGVHGNADGAPATISMAGAPSGPLRGRGRRDGRRIRRSPLLCTPRLRASHGRGTCPSRLCSRSRPAPRTSHSDPWSYGCRGRSRCRSSTMRTAQVWPTRFESTSYSTSILPSSGESFSFQSVAPLHEPRRITSPSLATAGTAPATDSASIGRHSDSQDLADHLHPLLGLSAGASGRLRQGSRGAGRGHNGTTVPGPRAQ